MKLRGSIHCGETNNVGLDVFVVCMTKRHDTYTVGMAKMQDSTVTDRFAGTGKRTRIHGPHNDRLNNSRLDFAGYELSDIGRSVTARFSSTISFLYSFATVDKILTDTEFSHSRAAAVGLLLFQRLQDGLRDAITKFNII